MERRALGTAVPAVTVSGPRLFVNDLGFLFALDLTTGKLLWPSEGIHRLKTIALQNQAQMVDPARFGLIASGDRIWCLARDMKDQNFMAPFRLSCRSDRRGRLAVGRPSRLLRPRPGQPAAARQRQALPRRQDGREPADADDDAAAAGPTPASRRRDPAPGWKNPLENRDRNVSTGEPILFLRHAGQRPTAAGPVARRASAAKCMAQASPPLRPAAAANSQF